MQNLFYALIQVVHNFGAVTVLGTAATALWIVRGNAAVQHRLAWLLAVAWAVQAISGTGFGVATFYFEGHLPDIHGIAVIALLIKIACAMTGFVLVAAYIKWHSGWAAKQQLGVWLTSFILGAIALGSAAFLRWFS